LDREEEADKGVAESFRSTLLSPDDGCPAKHNFSEQSSSSSQPPVNIDNSNKRYLSDSHPRISEGLVNFELMGRMKTDVDLSIHGYNTCAVEGVHNKRTVRTNKRIEYWKNWDGKCRLVQLSHNHGFRSTGEWLCRELGWKEVSEEVLTLWQNLDRDRAKHHQIKINPSYNSRQKILEYENAARKKKIAELTSAASKNSYSAKKQLLYPEVGKTGKEEVVVPQKRGRPRKWKC
jgi:hypothetical protein